MQTYVAQSATVDALWDIGAPAQQIDPPRKINDAPALQGFYQTYRTADAISRSAEDDIDFASQLQFIFLVISFFMLAAVIVAAVLIQRTQTATITGLSETMTDIESHKNFSTRIHNGRSDEVGQLTSTFDKLLATSNPC